MAEEFKTKIDPIGITLVIVFYIMVVFVGVWASKKQKDESPEEWVLAGRSLSGIVGVVTMISTWVCGGYLYGTTEAVIKPGLGLAWAQAPWGFSLCFWVGAVLFCKKMREANYITMLDPFQQKFGNSATALLYIPTVLGDVFWIAMALATLGACLSVLIGLPTLWAIIISAIFSALYTLIGGMYSVAYTDVIQLIMMYICLFLALPFVVTSDYIGDPAQFKDVWVGAVAKSDLGLWFDGAILLVLGGIPWQVYFQRVLASKTVKDAQVLSVFSGLGAFLSAVPPAIMGIYGTSVDWSQFAEVGSMEGKEGRALSYILKYLTPKAVGYIGLGGIAAATMSTADSAMLASSTVFTLNIYKPLFRPKASAHECSIVSKIGVFVIGIVSVVLAIVVDSIYGLWVLTSDFIFVLIFPQLLLVLYYSRMNVYGSIIGWIVGFILRVGIGEPVFKLKAFINFNPQIPAKTLAMLLNLATVILISELTRFLIVNMGCKKFDILSYYETPLGPRIAPSNETVVAAEEDKNKKKDDEAEQMTVVDLPTD